MKLTTVKNVVLSKLAATQYPGYRKRYQQSRSRAKTKLVAIAKNEAAYLPEWIFHHLYFGFDLIEIHFNGCTDNTTDLIDLINSKFVRFINADDMFLRSKNKPQMDIYRKAFTGAKQEGFDHVMFLDIDEFWTPYNFTSSITDFIEDAPYFDTLSFQWANKINEEHSFLRTINNQITVEPARQLKTLYKAFIQPGLMNPHNIMDNQLIRRDSSYNAFIPSNRFHSKAAEAVLPAKAVIIHRKYRSELEYVASLGKGKLKKEAGQLYQFKTNRSGYCNNKSVTTIEFGADAVSPYADFMNASMRKLEDNGFMETARDHVKQRFVEVIENIKNAPESQRKALKKMLRNVTLKEVLTVLDKLH